MKFILFLAFFTFNPCSLEYGVEYSKHRTQMKWKGVSLTQGTTDDWWLDDAHSTVG